MVKKPSKMAKNLFFFEFLKEGAYAPYAPPGSATVYLQFYMQRVLIHL